MRITRTPASMMTINDVPGLDPIRVITENYERGQGRIVIQCWDRAWCSAWFSMGDCTIEEFFADGDWGYLWNNLTTGLHGMRKDAAKRDEAYLQRIIVAVQKAFRAEMAA